MKSLLGVLAIVFGGLTWAAGIGTTITTILFFLSFFLDNLDVSWYHPLIGIGCYIGGWVITAVSAACLAVSLEK